VEWIDDGLDILPEETCHELLATATVGRVGMNLGALPVVLPVEFGVLDGAVVFATNDGVKLRAALDDAVVAFEADEIDPLTYRGWTVLLIGEARFVTDPAEIALIRALKFNPGVGGARNHWVRIQGTFLSGRRLAATTGASASDPPSGLASAAAGRYV
jgi:nitroimidazol reductase NimA-like FMN-containing flavoprotein (pyridoxamine 5'-phosphate oxidase superfamily)